MVDKMVHQSICNDSLEKIVIISVLLLHWCQDGNYFYFTFTLYVHNILKKPTFGR
jgi:hypothetical protein